MCGTVFQEPESQLVMNSVRAEIALALEHRGAAPGAVARAVEEVALALGVERCSTAASTRCPAASCSASRSPRRWRTGRELLLLDEPTSQLDPVAGDELIWLLRRLNEEWGTAVLMAEHRLERCLPAADRVVAIEGGARRLRRRAARRSSTGRVGARPAAGDARRRAVRARRAAAAAGLGEGGARRAGREPGSSRRRGGPRAERTARRAAAAPRRAARRRRARGVWYEIEDGPADPARRSICASTPGERSR